MTRNAFGFTLLMCTILNGTQVTAQTVTTLTPDSFHASGDLSVDAAGNIFVANRGTLSHDGTGVQVYKVTPEGSVNVFADGFLEAIGNAFDQQGNLYQASYDANRVDRISPDGVVTQFAGESEGLNEPTALAFDSHGNLYVSNCGISNIIRITPGGASTEYASGEPPFDCPTGLAFDDQDNLYVSNWYHNQIIKVTPQGSTSVLADTSPWSGGNRKNASMVFANGRLYLAGNGANRVFELSLDGELKPLAGNGQVGDRVDGPLLDAVLQNPFGLDISPDGRLLYANTSENNIIQNPGRQTPNVIRVIELPDVPSVIQINAGMTDAWFNDATAGQGFLIVVFPDQGIIFLAWFTYDTERPPGDVVALLGEAGHRWVTAQGPYEGDTATLTVYLTSGGVFDMAEPPATTDVDNPIGDITIVWHECSSATLTYTIDPPGVSGEIPLRRIVPDNEALCEALSQP